MQSFLLPGASRCRLCAAVRTASAHDFSKVLSLAHNPSWTRLPQTKLFCIQALWQCLSMPGKPRPLEALNSIISAGPRDLRRNKSCTDGVRVHRTVTGGGCQVPQEMDQPLLRRPTSWPENMGERLCFLWRRWGQEAALTVFRVPNWTPGWGCIKQFQRSLWPRAAVLSTWKCFLDCHELPIVS